MSHRVVLGILWVYVMVTLSCSSSSTGEVDAANRDATDDVMQMDSGVDQAGDAVDAADSSGDVGEPLETPVADPEAAARAFRLYYRERVERSVLVYNRLMLFGDVTFGVTIGKAGVSREGNAWEVVAGPNDNNHIGMSMWGVWNAYKVFRSRTLALSLIRMLNGLVFFEQVSGHPGLTARMVYPGWTRTVDGQTGTVARERKGVPVESPVIVDAALEEEILAAFYSGVEFTYREDPEDILLNYMPTAEIGPYCVTYSFNMLPDYLRVSDCCTSLKRTPAPYLWEGAFFGNHNSRDNFPDLSMGYLVALEAMNDPLADEDLKAAAAAAWEAGNRIGDLVQSSNGCLMTVDEHNPYDVLVVAGAVRPDGETESQDLGSMADCQMPYLARALSSQGLAAPLPGVPAPGSLEYLLVDFLGDQCPIFEPVHVCTRLGEAWCGKDWATIGELELMGVPWLELVQQLEEDSPGSAESLVGSFQDDFNEISMAALGLVNYAVLSGDPQLLELARTSLKEILGLYRFFGELIWLRTEPERLADRYYEAGLFEATGGLEVPLSDMNDFARAEQHMARLEAMLVLPDTVPAALRTDEEILQLAEERLGGVSESTRQRYREAYGETPPLRRTDDGYEAREYKDGALTEWRKVDNQHHVVFGGVHLLEALPLCVTAPELLDCTWAVLGCERPDLDGSGTVDEADQALFDAARTTHAGITCGSSNAWCDGADLDRTGTVDDVDSAFLSAAQGCTR